MRERGAVYWGRSGMDGISKTMYRPSTSRKMCVYPPPQGKEKKSPALPTPFLPLRPLLQPPAAPSHSSYEPRAGRSEYNFLYCVNVRTIRLNKKKMFILRNAGVWIIASLTFLPLERPLPARRTRKSFHERFVHRNMRIKIIF